MEFKDLVLRDSADYQIVPIPSLDKRIRKKNTAIDQYWHSAQFKTL